MLGINVNLLAVLISAVAAMVVGSFWYGPIFGKKWMKLSGITKSKVRQMQKKGMAMSYVTEFVSSFVFAFILSVFIGLAGATTVMSGIVVAFWAWLGFQAAKSTAIVSWEGKPWTLYWIYAMGSLIISIVMAAIIVAM